ncbi:eif4g domain protein [Holotrichia oblita]|uniref:Eif4g domain protein n=1 Tax=Holotrichia oblita TaxID=644536 RepID=A0ACB9TK18_HOLOL|nr:eif4g domain protein [Holotrichia oblita]
MATSGVGRGRGWLNLNKNTMTKPGQTPSGSLNSPTAELQNCFISPTLPNNGACPQQYAKLISLINQLSNIDDGILINQKFKVIIDTWSQDCPTSNQVEECFNYIYQKCLEDEIFALKVVGMVASNTFSQLEISQQRIRRLFIGHIQRTYEGRKQLQQSNPNGFRIAVRILSEFYHKARLATGKQITLLVAPLLSYLEMLLESAQPADIQLFTQQLSINGAAIKTECRPPQHLNDILNKVRQTLICNLQLTQMSKLILLLAIDLANNRYGLLPADVLKFYQEELGDKVMANFQGSLGALSIQTQQSNKTLDSYQSNVSVLQVTPPDSTSPIGDSSSIASITTKNTPSQHQTQPSNTSNTAQTMCNTTSQQAYSNNNSTSNYTNDSGMNVGGSSGWDTKKEKTAMPNREKTGRPILGAGARFHKDRQENTGNWRDHQHKDDSSNWSKDKTKSNSNSGWGEKKSKSYNNKGWEHDDRFETDYQ